MSWLSEHKRLWRTAVLIVAALAFAGPWAFEGVYVPADHPCSFPSVRLDADFCGLPVPGVFILFLWLIGGFTMLVRALTLTELSRALQISSVLLALWLSLLPLVTTLALIMDEDRRLRFPAVVWGAAAIAVALFTLTDLSRPHPALWGIWLYVGLAICAMALELAVSVAGRRPGRAQP